MYTYNHGYIKYYIANKAKYSVNKKKYIRNTYNFLKIRIQ